MFGPINMIHSQDIHIIMSIQNPPSDRRKKKRKPEPSYAGIIN